jgi:hypothetical protein
LLARPSGETLDIIGSTSALAFPHGNWGLTEFPRPTTLAKRFSKGLPWLN